MRNLKRALSLALASVMLMGMMVVGTSAASFPDVDGEDNIEAIDVLETVQVMIGDEGTGEFRPDDPVNRAEMAVVMAKLLNLDYNYYVTSCPFTDVSGNYEWAKGWVGACAANGIVSGRGEGIFDPGATVTAVEAASMMMRALGYFQYPGDYQGGFETATVKQASQISLFSGIDGNANDPLNRNQVAKLALNALESNMVYFSGDVGFDFNGVTVGYRSQYTYRTGTESKYAAISGLGDATVLNGTQLAQGQHYVNLGEQLYDGDLKLYDNRVDDFGRPSRRWEYDGKAIGTYIKKDQLKEEYTEKVTGKMLYELLGKDVVDDYKFYITIDGETTQDVLNYPATGEKDQYYFTQTALNRTNTNQVGGTDKGVLTQVFVDGSDKEVYIAIINTYLVKATDDYNTRRNEVSFDIWGVTRTPGSVKALVKADDITNVKVSGEDFEIEEVETDDIFLAWVADNEIKEMFTPEVIDDTTISAFKNGSYVVADKQYDYASTAKYDDDTLNQYSNTNMKDTTYRIYLDLYGYLIGIEKVESENHYAFLTGINSYNENLKDQTAIGNVVFLDGTSKNITIDMKKSKNAQDHSFSNQNVGETKVNSLMNTWCTYSVDSDNVYTLKEVANDTSVNNKKLGQSHMGGTYKDGSDIKYYATGATNPTTGDPQVVPVNNNSVNAGNHELSWGKTNDGTNEEYVTIDKGHVSLDGIAGSNYQKVYGNKDTVYLSAELDIINAKNALSGSDADSVIITGADSVSVGVQTTDLKAYNAQAVVKNESDYQKSGMKYMDVSDGVYTLFNDKGYVIAAMVVGTDDGSSTSFAWVSSGSMNREGYGDGKWEYSRDVIVNGKETTLTEVETGGEDDPDISADTNNDDKQTSFWWEVKTKADGTVKSAKRIPTLASGDYDYVTDINLDDKDGTTILSQGFNLTTGAGTIGGVGGPFKVRVTGNTLQVESRTGEIRGFAVSPNAGIAVVKDERIYRNSTAQDEWNWKEDIEYFTNDDDANGLRRAVSYLTDDDNFQGYIAAVLKDGRAECVVLYDKADADVDIGGEGGSTEGIISTTFNGTDRVDIFYQGARPTGVAQLNAIIAELKNQPHVVRVENAKLNGNDTFDATLVMDDGSTVTLDDVVIGLANSKMDASGMDSVIDELENQTTDPYEFAGNVAMDANTKTVTFTGAYGADGQGTVTDSNGHTVGLVTDLSRFLGALYRQMGVRAITFNSRNYTWDPANAAASHPDRTELAGSNWYCSTTTAATLVADVVTASGTAISGNNNTIDGVSFEMKLDGVTWTIEIALP